MPVMHKNTAAIVKQKRDTAKLGLEEAARAASMSVFKLYRIEQLKQPLKVEDAIALAKIFHCSPLELLPELEEALASAEVAR